MSGRNTATGLRRAARTLAESGGGGEFNDAVVWLQVSASLWRFTPRATYMNSGIRR